MSQLRVKIKSMLKRNGPSIVLNPINYQSVADQSVEIKYEYKESKA